MRSTRLRPTAAGRRPRFRSRRNLTLENLDGAVAERIRALQRQLATEINTLGQSRAGAGLEYLPAEDSLLQTLRLEGFGYRQIVRVSYPLFSTSILEGSVLLI